MCKLQKSTTESDQSEQWKTDSYAVTNPQGRCGNMESKYCLTTHWNREHLGWKNWKLQQKNCINPWHQKMWKPEFPYLIMVFMAEEWSADNPPADYLRASMALSATNRILFSETCLNKIYNKIVQTLKYRKGKLSIMMPSHFTFQTDQLKTACGLTPIARFEPN